ncbi:MAG: glycosyltransferase family 4 protein, partial [Thermodesulfobacteriota bacterium]|nr:glycosyltransferase family 4 protein [Thermodesulfobacteriota bacterium]
LKLLCKQGIFMKDLPHVIELFARLPYAFFNVLPPIIFGFQIPGLKWGLGPLWKKELFSHMDFFETFDVIHCAMPFNPLWTIIRGRPTVIEAQDSSFSVLKMRLVREGLKSGAFFNCASERIRTEYNKKWNSEEPNEKLFVSPCSFIDYTKTFVAPKEKIITFVGRLDQYTKNPEMFVKAIDRVAQVRNDFKVYMLGNGPLAKKIDHLIRIKGLQKIIIRRFDPCPQEVLSRSLIYVSLQQYDNYHSQALMEAMACGCAIVSSDVGETWRLVSNDVGYRVPLKIDSFVDRLLYLLDNPDLAIRMGQLARSKIIEEHKISIYANYLETLYEKAFRS